MMTSEDKKNYSEAFKNVVIALSVIIGGIWAFYTFDAKLEAQNAKAQLKKVEYELTQRPVLIPNMKVFSVDSGSSESWILKVRLKIENIGNTDVEINLDQESIRVAKIKLKDGVIIGYQDPIYVGERGIPPTGNNIKYTRTKLLTVLAHQSKELMFLVEVSEQGIYEVIFEAKPGKAVERIRDNILENAPTYSVISVTDYIAVGSTLDMSLHSNGESAAAPSP